MSYPHKVAHLSLCTYILYFFISVESPCERWTRWTWWSASLNKSRTFLLGMQIAYGFGLSWHPLPLILATWKLTIIQLQPFPASDDALLCTGWQTYPSWWLLCKADKHWQNSSLYYIIIFLPSIDVYDGNKKIVLSFLFSVKEVGHIIFNL